uniref:Variable surface glycoprotein n=1 Tax=Trypanosoma evansi TaxID=5697 RepID=Q968M1_TRYEV|nr:variable surface glycoprotein [Trypanosoma evansi]
MRLSKAAERQQKMKPMSCSKQSAASVLLAVLLATTGTEGAANMGLLKGTWVPLCKLAQELGEVTSEAATEQKNILKLALEFRKEALQLKIYSRVAATAEDAERAVVLAAYVQSLAQRAVDKIQTTDGDKFLAAVAATSYAKGATDEFIQLGCENQRRGQPWVLTRYRHNATTSQARRIDSTECKTGTPKPQGTGRTTKTIKAAGISGPKQGLENSNSLQSANKNCRLFAKSSSDGLAKASNLDTNKLHYAAGYIEIDNSGGNAGKVNLLNLNRPTLTDQPEATAWQAVITTVGALPKITDEAYTNTSDKLESTERAAETIARIIKNVDDGTIANSKAAITNLFGTTSKEHVDKLLSDAANYKLKDKIAEQIKKHHSIQCPLTSWKAILAALDIALIKDKDKLKQELTDAKQNKETKSAEDKEKECNKAGSDQKACEKLKEQGCVYKEDGEENKKCKFNEKSFKSGAPVTQTQTGAAETTTDKCKDKKKDDCKSPDCKWEGESCKDSSILVNKQFALSVVSAAFVALLF